MVFTYGEWALMAKPLFPQTEKRFEIRLVFEIVVESCGLISMLDCFVDGEDQTNSRGISNFRSRRRRAGIPHSM